MHDARCIGSSGRCPARRTSAVRRDRQASYATHRRQRALSAGPAPWDVWLSLHCRPGRHPFHHCDPAPGGLPGFLKSVPALAHLILPDRAGTMRRRSAPLRIMDEMPAAAPAQTLSSHAVAVPRTYGRCCAAMATRTCIGGKEVDTNHARAITVFSAAALTAYLCRMTRMRPPGSGRVGNGGRLFPRHAARERQSMGVRHQPAQT